MRMKTPRYASLGETVVIRIDRAQSAQSNPRSKGWAGLPESDGADDWWNGKFLHRLPRQDPLQVLADE
jgi:hypothetical protein